METFILWIGFIGAWLIFAGALRQATLELQNEDIEIDRIREASSKIPRPAPTSKWLLLVFPIKLYIDFKRGKEHQRQISALLTSDDVKSLTSLRNKAIGWMSVAGGGFCIALKETYELGHHQEWGGGILLGLVIFMFILSVLNAALMRREVKIERK